ncbi:MAG TPA: hypothetical protein VMI11_07735, partial [Actinomycetes bacterium]|nr:hypothetical protein [Actinomycetes bacterium]
LHLSRSPAGGWRPRGVGAGGGLEVGGLEVGGLEVGGLDLATSGVSIRGGLVRRVDVTDAADVPDPRVTHPRGEA